MSLYSHILSRIGANLCDSIDAYDKYRFVRSIFFLRISNFEIENYLFIYLFEARIFDVLPKFQHVPHFPLSFDGHRELTENERVVDMVYHLFTRLRCYLLLVVAAKCEYFCHTLHVQHESTKYY